MNSVRTALLAIATTLVVMAPGFAMAQESVVGEWVMITNFQGQQIQATMTLSLEDEKLVGVWSSQGSEMPMQNIVLRGNSLSFGRPMGPGGASLAFVGTVDGDKIKGQWDSEMGDLTVSGTRKP